MCVCVRVAMRLDCKSLTLGTEAFPYLSPGLLGHAHIPPVRHREGAAQHDRAPHHLALLFTPTRTPHGKVPEKSPCACIVQVPPLCEAA